MKATRNIIKKFYLILFLWIGLAPSYANEIRFKSIKNVEWWRIVSEARQQHKPIFLDFYTVWCGSCRRMDKVVLQDPAVAWKFNQNFVNVKVDAETLDGIELAQRYNVTCFPTYIFIDDAGKMLYKSEGMASVETFLGFATDALEVFGWRSENPISYEPALVISKNEPTYQPKPPVVVKKTTPNTTKPVTKSPKKPARKPTVKKTVTKKKRVVATTNKKKKYKKRKKYVPKHKKKRKIVVRRKTRR